MSRAYDNWLIPAALALFVVALHGGYTTGGVGGMLYVMTGAGAMTIVAIEIRGVEDTGGDE
jgi:hypothetical protein